MEGIGDDCAVLRFPADDLVWSIDASLEGSHFLMDWMGPGDVAHKSFHAALSDVPAMGARPLAAICQLSLSSRVNEAWLRAFARAQRIVSEQTGVPIVGGNITWGKTVGVVTSVLGAVEKNQALKRSGAQPDDEIWLLGELGLAAAGLRILQTEEELQDVRASERAVCLEAFRRPHAQLGSTENLARVATSCLDVSDGLVRDASRLAEASGVALVFEPESLQRILRPELKSVALALGTTPKELALFGGEDYALLATGPSAARPLGARALGFVERGAGVYEAQGESRVSLLGGFEHGA